MNSDHKSSSFFECDDEDQSSSKLEKKVKSFLKFNFFIFILMIVGIKIAILWKISIIWGAFLAFKFWSRGNCSNRRYGKRRHSKEQYGRPQRPDWREKDLV